MADIERTPEMDYTACCDSVDLINGIYDGTMMVDDDQADKDDAIARNKEHLQLMIDKGEMADAGCDVSALQSAIDRTS